MSFLRHRYAVSASTMVLLAAVPAFSQTSSSNQKGFAYPPLHRIVNPDINPDAGPTGIFPSKMRVAYGFSQLKFKGSGQTIAIIDAYDDPTIENDLGVFSTRFGLPACTTANGCFQKIYGSGTKPPADTSGWSNEISIDVEWAHAIAPLAKIILVEGASNSFDDLNTAVDTAVANGATVVSMSYGGGEYSTELADDVHFNVPNVTMVASSGDGGHGVSNPASSPYVVSVGGTTLTINSSTGAYVSETAWSGSGGGVSRYEPEPVYQDAVQTSGMRTVPDVAYDANPSTGVPAYSSNPCGACYTGWTQWGGTSISAPQWAGLFAVANGVRMAQGKANLNQVQYLLYTAPSSDFHDITSGTNGSCGAQCTAKVGYDYVTGLGSPLANTLIPVLVSAP